MRLTILERASAHLRVRCTDPGAFGFQLDRQPPGASGWRVHAFQRAQSTSPLGLQRSVGSRSRARFVHHPEPARLELSLLYFVRRKEIGARKDARRPVSAWQASETCGGAREPWADAPDVECSPGN